MLRPESAQFGLKRQPLGQEPVAFGSKRLPFLEQPPMLGCVHRIRIRHPQTLASSLSFAHHGLDCSDFGASIVPDRERARLES